MKKGKFYLLCISIFFNGILQSQTNAFFDSRFYSVSNGIKIAASTQSKIYARVYGGMGFGIAPANIGTNYTVGPGFGYTYETVNGSYGKGVFFGVAGGYKLTPNLGAGIGIEQFMGNKFTIANTNLNSSSSTVTSVSGLCLKPAINFFIYPHPKMTTFGGLGINLGVTDKMKSINTTTTTQLPNSITTVSEKNISPVFKPGMFAEAGINWSITQSLGVFFALEAQAKSFLPKSDVTNSYTVNGTDQLSSLNTRQKQTTYSTKLGTIDTDPTKPYQALAQRSACSALNMMIGVTFGFGKSESGNAARRKNNLMEEKWTFINSIH